MEEAGLQLSGANALPAGRAILAGQYEIMQLVQRRPRLNLYIGRRLAMRGDGAFPREAHEDFVAIRELVLTGLAPQTCVEIEQAAFEEFVSPLVPGSPRLPGAVDRVFVEGERHYLLMHLNGFKGGQSVTLSKLLLSWRTWPLWLDEEAALRWGAQLCRIVARLHRSGLVLGDLAPTTVLVDGAGVADWEPTLLVSWPPAPIFWSPTSSNMNALERYQHIFPLAQMHTAHAFAAPEMLAGQTRTCDVRSDVYSLGAILYLLLTRYAPVAAVHRLGLTGETGLLDSIGLIQPQHLNKQLPGKVSEILLRSLAIEPGRRYPTVFAMAEEIEAVVEEESRD